MRIISVFTVLLVTLFSGCASIQKNIVATSYKNSEPSKKLLVSAEINENLSSEYFGMIEFTFENLTNKWISIESIDIDINKDANRSSIKFTTGSDFTSWGKAITKRNKIDNYNKSIAYSAIIGLATATGMSSSNKTVKSLSAGISAVALTSLTIDEITKLKSRAESVAIFPEDHLLSGEFRVPPELFTNNWLLINTDDNETNNLLYKLYITVNYKDSSSEKFVLQLFNSRNLGRNIWQNNLQQKLRTELRMKRFTKS